jgi:hypothetical protein
VDSAAFVFVHRDLDLATPSVWECVLETVGNQFIDNQTAGNRNINGKADVVDRRNNAYAVGIRYVGTEQMR